MSGEDFSVKQPFPFNVFRVLLFVLSTIYGAVVSLRIWLYEKQILKSRKVPCFVISIGNVVAGGSGKTPMAIYIAEMVKSLGFNPVVISRGYGGSLSKKRLRTDSSDSSKMRIFINNSRASISDVSCNVIVGDGNTLFETPEVVGDEPFMMASRLSFPVVVGKDRFKAAIMALSNITAQKIDVIILDDGFQHIQLKRDLNIVLMDYSRPFGNGYLLPAGRLREPAKRAIDRADIIVFTRYPDDNLKSFDKSYVERIVSHKGKMKTFFITKHRPFLHTFLPNNQTSLDYNSNIFKQYTLNDLKNRKGCLFSGIADNQSFRKTVENLGVSVKAHLEFNDHHMYKSGEILTILDTFKECGADLLITTEKDYARLVMDKQYIWSMDFAVIGIEIDFLNKKDEFQNVIYKNLSVK
ncbi:MAG: tetraacyldisaccharide 4'-kinase [Desulfamplus sp.]|nr:tetraacyldisaccharide 4'-kinase [Desulfamplus sp.]